MEDIERKRIEAIADIIKAMAHPSRLIVVTELAEKDRCVCELNEKVDADMSTVSKHLSILKSAGIVETTKKGARVYYSLKAKCVLGLIDCVEELLKTSAEEVSKIMGDKK